MNTIIYHNPKCSKSCYALEYLEKHNIDKEVRLYLKRGVTRAVIFDILELLNVNISDVLREKEQVFVAQYSSTGIVLSKEGIVNAIIKNPILLQRPIILLKEKGVGVVARSKEILDRFFTKH